MTNPSLAGRLRRCLLSAAVPAFSPLVAILGCFAFLARPALADTLWATNQGNALIKIDTATRTITPVGTSFGFSQTWNIEFDIDGTLWATPNFGQSLGKVNTTTGVVTIVAPLTVETISTAIDSDGTMYALGYNDGKLYKVNKTTGVMTAVGSTGVFSSMDSEIDASGNLWSLDAGSHLIEINKSTGAQIRTITLPTTMMSFSIDSSNTGYVISWSSAPVMYTVNLSTGVVTSVGSLSMQFVHGGTFQRTGIGVNFTGGKWAVAATGQPGIVAGGNWNNVGGTSGGVGINAGAGVGSNIALVDTTGATTTAKLSFEGAYDAGNGGEGGTGTSNAATNTLYQGGIWGDPASREVSITVTGIPYPHYNVYVYADGGGSSNTLSFTNGTTTYYYAGNGQPLSSATSLTQATSTDPNHPTVGTAHYILFSTLSGSTLTLTSGGSVNGVVANNVFGIQIVPTSAPAVQAPVINSPTSASGVVGLAFNYQITATNSPTSFTAAGLPANLSFNGVSGLISGIPATAGSYTIGLAASNSGGTGTGSSIFNIAKGTATVSFTNTTQTYTGSPLTPTVSTSPGGLSVSVTYNGTSTAPSNVGGYSLLGTVNDPNYTGSGSGNFTITAATASFSFDNLSAIYDGTPKTVTATPTPAAAGASVTYNGTSTAPTNAGSYTVIASPTNPNYAGSATANFTIAQATANVAIGNTAQSFDNTPKPVTVSTSPSGLGTSVTYNGTPTVPSAIGSYAVVANVADLNYTGSATATLTIKDTTPPVIAPLGNITAEATSAAGAAVTFNATATDNVDGPVAVTTTPVSGSTFPLGTTTVTATANDAAGNVATSSFTVTVGDTTAPTIAATSNLTVEATSANGAVVAFTPTATDLVSGAVAVTASPASGSTFPLGTTAVTLTANDAAGNTATSTFNVTVQDTTAPVISVTTASDFTENFNGYTNGLPYYPQYQSGLQQEYQGDVPGWSKSGFHAVHAVNLDGQGNWAVMIWQDNVITSIGTTADNASGVDYVVHFNAGPAVSADPSQATSATDGLLIKILRADNTVLSQLTYLPGAWAGAPALVPVSFHYTGDGSGAVHMSIGPSAPNSGRFGGAIDDISITPSTPANITLEATTPAGAVATWGAAAYDLVSGNVGVAASPASGSVFALGTTPVTLTANDAAGNTATSTFTVTVRDTTAPTLTVPANQTLEATGPNGAVATFNATSTDAVTAQPAIAYSIASGSTFALGTTIVTVTAKDDAGNVSSGAFTITVKDTTPPTIATPANIVAEATNANGAVVTFNATATDLVSGAVTVTATPASGSTFPLGDTTVTLTAVDAAGNSATSTFKVTVQDTTPPTITPPANIVAEATSANGAAVTFNATATDLVSASVAMTASPASGSTFALGTTTVTLTAKDAAGNTATSSFTVTVRDTTPPTLTVPANMVVEATSAAGAVATYAATANDAVTAAPTITYSIASGTTFALGTTTVNVTAADAAGNESTGSFTVTVQDTTPPTIATPANIVAEATSANGAVVSFNPTATDIVSGSVAVTASPVSGSTFALGTTTVSLTAKDAAGNTATSSFTVTVRDTTRPALTVPANMVVEATSAAGAVANFAAAATDTVTASPAIAYSQNPGTTFPIGTTTVTVTATDAAGNQSTGSFTVTVRDTTPPTISSLSASPKSIWPPNKKMVPVTITANTTDLVGVASIKIVSVATNEPNNNTQWQIMGALTLNLLADRLGTGTGRIYTITVEVRDAVGNTSTKTCTVTVPHDQGS